MLHYFNREKGAIFFSFLVSFLLQMMPFPEKILVFQPNWILLFLLYWLLSLPYQVNIGTSFFIGSILDIMNDSIFGIRILATSIMSYLALSRFQSFYIISLWQQTLVIFLLLCSADFFILLGEFLLMHSSFRIEVILNNLVSSILWPWLFILMNKIRRSFLVK